ncbi:hypothetical protein M0R45_006821 [Rubus argutus]|uniref:Integrase zinc-binding domain-containing protein n=1 Tax=Rubus argutus TaxID=59490 RepID=A0AAW1YS05_RUBAR
MKSPIPVVPLKLYLTATHAAIEALLAQDDGSGVEHPVYYVSRLLGEAKTRYPRTERVCLALIYAAQRLHHYFLAHKLHLMTKPSIEVLILHEAPEKDDWRNSIKSSLTSQGNEINLKTLKDYIILHEELYMRLLGGILARYICEKEARQRLHQVHEATCRLEQVISLYRRLQRKGYYWPRMKEQASEIQVSCPKCSVLPSEEEVFTVATTEDWRTPYLMFLLNNTLPTDARCRYKLKKTSKRYFINGEVLYIKGFNGEPLRCLDNVESLQVLNEVHAGECGEHQGKRKLYQQILSLGYYWPSMRKDAHLKVKRCHTCQAHANLSHKPPTLLQDMRTLWPFHTWGLDFVGKINPPSDGHVWIITSTEFFTKWVEAIPMRKATRAALSNFIKEYIVCRKKPQINVDEDFEQNGLLS